MSDVQELRGRLRDTAIAKRDQLAKRSIEPDLASVLRELTEVLKGIQGMLAAHKAGPTDFTVTERDADGKIAAFKVNGK